MKCHLLTAPGRIEARDLPDPIPGPGEMLVRIRAALTCGTDLKAFRRGHPKIPLPSGTWATPIPTIRCAGARPRSLPSNETAPR